MTNRNKSNRQNKWQRATAGHDLSRWEADNVRAGRPAWYAPYKRETADARRTHRRKARKAAKAALRAGNEPARVRNTCGWLSH